MVEQRDSSSARLGESLKSSDKLPHPADIRKMMVVGNQGQVVGWWSPESGQDSGGGVQFCRPRGIVN